MKNKKKTRMITEARQEEIWQEVLSTVQCIEPEPDDPEADMIKACKGITVEEFGRLMREYVNKFYNELEETEDVDH